MIKPNDSFRLRDRLANAEVVFLRDVGHLAHEERPAEIAELILSRAVQAGILAAPEADTSQTAKP
jgi:magnesium chelatase accessory protein